MFHPIVLTSVDVHTATTKERDNKTADNTHMMYRDKNHSLFLAEALTTLGKSEGNILHPTPFTVQLTGF
jgi:hypothetical protein